MGGKRGYGPTHSQSLEKHFLGLPGTRMLPCITAYDPGALYDTLFATIDRPTIVIENKLLYGLRIGGSAPDGFALEQTDEPFPTTRIRPEVRARRDDPLLRRHAAPTSRRRSTRSSTSTRSPARSSARRSSIRSTSGRSSSRSSGPAGSWSSRKGSASPPSAPRSWPRSSSAPPGALQRLRRLAAAEHPIPSCGPLEKALLPGPEHVVAAVLELSAMTEPTPILVPRENVNDEIGDARRLVVADGARVEPGQPVAQIETSKAVVDLPAPAAGVLRPRARAGGRPDRRRARLGCRRGAASPPDALWCPALARMGTTASQDSRRLPPLAGRPADRRRGESRSGARSGHRAGRPDHEGRSPLASSLSIEFLPIQDFRKARLATSCIADAKFIREFRA